MIRDFEYLVPKTLEEAYSLLSELREEAKIIAGGQSLLLFMKQGLISPSYLIDIKSLLGKDLSYITFDNNGGLKIGALTTHREIEKSPIIWEEMPVLAEMEQQVAHIQIRNWGTIGGNLCHADPAGDPAPLLIALEATVKVVSKKGERAIQLEAFSKDYYETALGIDEILAEIQIPRPSPYTGIAYTRFAFMKGESPMVSAAVSVTLDPKDGGCKDVRIGLGAAAPTPIRARRAEEILKGKKIEQSLIEEAGRVASEEAQPISDVHASEEYKRRMVKVLVKQTVNKALEKVRMQMA